jgi:hypothetical protein
MTSPLEHQFTKSPGQPDLCSVCGGPRKGHWPDEDQSGIAGATRVHTLQPAKPKTVSVPFIKNGILPFESEEYIEGEKSPNRDGTIWNSKTSSKRLLVLSDSNGMYILPEQIEGNVKDK